MFTFPLRGSSIGTMVTLVRHLEGIKADRLGNDRYKSLFKKGPVAPPSLRPGLEIEILSLKRIIRRIQASWSVGTLV